MILPVPSICELLIDITLSITSPPRNPSAHSLPVRASSFSAVHYSRADGAQLFFARSGCFCFFLSLPWWVPDMWAGGSTLKCFYSHKIRPYKRASVFACEKLRESKAVLSVLPEVSQGQRTIRKERSHLQKKGETKAFLITQDKKNPNRWNP